MKTNIELDDTLLRDAMKAGGFRTKKAAVVEGLNRVASIQGQSSIRKLFGKFQWEGDLEESRRSRFSDWDVPQA